MKFVWIVLFILFVPLAWAHNETTEDTQHDAAHVQPYTVPEGNPVPTVSISVESDSVKGWNIHIRTTNFTFTPQNVGGEDVPNEGHAHAYVDGEKIARVYGEYYYIDSLPGGIHTLKVGLNANSHKPYFVDNQEIADAILLTVEGTPELETEGVHEDEVIVEPNSSITLDSVWFIPLFFGGILILAFGMGALLGSGGKRKRTK